MEFSARVINFTQSTKVEGRLVLNYRVMVKDELLGVEVEKRYFTLVGCDFNFKAIKDKDVRLTVVKSETSGLNVITKIEVVK